ncbi:replication initiator protein A [Sutcliffiella horikoshii]|uniref:Replication initiator A N-terminal domain-containing protein n=1 Tax=Sutcliffiella horikoshii TaxID=79883 RepID=A0A5D4T9H9_9BACI|nr:replication initiator protein A [Sutcliffiella horikoshii]TYS72373.1 hypothetical protein FZC75_10485 [Sutcliffiella horikoshii]
MKNKYNRADNDGIKFYRLPKVLCQNPTYNNMKARNKLAYAVLQGRLDNSKKNGWKDKNGDIYFFYSNQNLMKVLNCCETTVTSITKELLEAKLIMSVDGGRAKKYYLCYPFLSEGDIYRVDYKDNSISDNLGRDLTRFVQTRMNSKKNEKDQYSEKYYKIPTVFMKNTIYKKLSSNAKILYGVFQDRLSFSEENGLYDLNGDYYFEYKMSDLSSVLCVSMKSARKYKDELVKAQLLHEERTGRASKFYLLKPELTEEDLYLISKTKKVRDNPSNHKVFTSEEHKLKVRKEKFNGQRGDLFGTEQQSLGISNTFLNNFISNNNFKSHHPKIEVFLTTFLKENQIDEEAIFNLTYFLKHEKTKNLNEADLLELTQFIIKKNEQFNTQLIDEVIHYFFDIEQYESNKGLATIIKLELSLFLSQEKVKDTATLSFVITQLEAYPTRSQNYRNHFKAILASASNQNMIICSKKNNSSENEKPNWAILPGEKISDDDINYYRLNNLDYFFHKYGVELTTKVTIYLEKLNAKVVDTDIVKVLACYLMDRFGFFDFYYANEFESMFLNSTIKEAISYLGTELLTREQLLQQDIKIYKMLEYNECQIEQLEQQLHEIQLEKAQYY